MKRMLTLAVAVAGLALSAPVLAQTTTTTTTDAYGNTGVASTTGTAGTTYGGTGWDPSMVTAISGALAAGSLALKGVLRRSR